VLSVCRNARVVCLGSELRVSYYLGMESKV
jgi:hypothetical protein